MKKGKLKKKYEEKINKRKAKANPICKVHKGKHQYTRIKKDYGFSSFSNNYETKTVVMQCDCGKQHYTDIPVKSGNLLTKLVLYCQDNPDKTFEEALSKFNK